MTLQPIPRVTRLTRFVTGTTPFSNFLLDRVMPRLTDTEWRVLAVIVRQTFGWHLGGGIRKRTDWMSHFQLKQRTGRQSAAISRAIDGLVRAGLISVRDLHGRPLYLPAQRRRSHEHLIFAIHPLVATHRFQHRFTHSRFGSSRSENNKKHYYKRKQKHG